MGEDESVKVDQAFADALDALLDAQGDESSIEGPDPRHFLELRGVVLPENASVEVRNVGMTDSGLEAKAKTCWEVCVDIKFVSVCRTKCR
jgi:hypothetical protein